jgi:hypothetical protein
MASQQKLLVVEFTKDLKVKRLVGVSLDGPRL